MGARDTETGTERGPESPESELASDDFTFKFHLTSAMLVFGALSFLLLVALLLYANYRSKLLESTQPIVETCVKHRITQEVKVSP